MNRLYEQRVRRRDVALLVGSALLAVVVMMLVSDSMHVFLHGFRFTFTDWWDSARHAF